MMRARIQARTLSGVVPVVATLLLATPAVAQEGKAEPAAKIPTTEGGTQRGTAGDAGAGKEMAHAQLEDAQGKNVGWVRIRETPNGLILHARFSGVPDGEHAFHVHQVGKCEPPFESAGDHYNPGKSKHGFAVEGGPHAGDLPNLTIPQAGNLEVDFFAAHLTVRGKNALLDDDGSALIVHEKIDDYASQPSGNAGKRIACGVVKAGAMTGADAGSAR